MTIKWFGFGATETVTIYVWNCDSTGFRATGSRAVAAQFTVDVVRP
jgi:hypothetical protein